MLERFVVLNAAASRLWAQDPPLLLQCSSLKSRMQLKLLYPIETVFKNEFSANIEPSAQSLLLNAREVFKHLLADFLFSFAERTDKPWNGSMEFSLIRHSECLCPLWHHKRSCFFPISVLHWFQYVGYAALLYVGHPTWRCTCVPRLTSIYLSLIVRPGGAVLPDIIWAV